ncbi:MAG: 3-deoxy-8-phosphooctulonate synthase [candidate division KSB1 bacterium]|nr:3-deoxy-8-phosphooctulonate synthase [candidate division KSB1 bacterium]MDZ7357860.1 3-deoxy-8-phosphooctulonate synthase [candidate division KSB1 bacterium]MDZ7375283.1 3-deoxy-8-phosphooctulonate synthase [candidate division KSB1 bacterium]MDZ7400412.1 3-deoxy-8-phosphooctulonate synthase [candidate division KSB1 bacterium]
MMKAIRINNITITENSPFVLIAGPCVIETERIALQTAEEIRKITDELRIPYIYKSSYSKANRQSIESYTGPGLEQGLRILEKVKQSFEIPILTDIHSPQEAAPVAEVADVLQIPAFLCRQTDIVVAAAKTGKPINIKKGQFMAPEDMGAIAAKAVHFGNDQIMLTERGTTFGYHNLVVDFRSLVIMKNLGYPVVFDATHSLQLPGGAHGKSGGQPQFIFPLARAGMAVGVQALFLETHPCVEEALCDAANMLPLQQLRSLLVQLKELDGIIKKI